MRRRFLATVPASGRRWSRRRHRTCVHRRARWRAPPRGTQRPTRRRCRAQVASATAAAAAAAAAASLGVKPQAEAPHSAPVAPRGALRRRLRRRTCTARARTQRHRSVLRARAGPTWKSERSSLRSARFKARGRKGPRAGRWQFVLRTRRYQRVFSVAPQAKHGAPSMFLTASPGLEDGVLCCFGFLLQGFCFRVVASGLLLRGHKTQRVFSVAPQAKHGSASTFLNGITAWRGIARPRGSRGRPPWRSRNP